RGFNMGKQKAARGRTTAKKATPKKPAKTKIATKPRVKKPDKAPRWPQTGGAAPKPSSPPPPPKPAARTPPLPPHRLRCDCYLPNQTDEGSYGSLSGCVRDADQVEQFLRKRAGLTNDRLIKLTSTAGAGDKPKEPPERWPTYKNMVGAFQKIADQARAGD